MKHTLVLDGYCYRLRPVTLDDAEFIIDIRLADDERTKYMHEIPNDPEAEKRWIESYFQREGDFFFVVEDRFTGAKEGLIGIYDVNEGRAEWGRWVIQKGSMASVESVYLLYQIAFDKLRLNELYCRTVEDNQAVVSFHTSVGLNTRTVLKDFFVLNDSSYNAVEQYLGRADFEDGISQSLNQKCYLIFQRFFRRFVGKLEFHHIGIACKNIEKEAAAFQILGYQFEEKKFLDTNQGIVGRFGIAHNQPRIELLENMENSSTLNPYLDKGVKLYHYAYKVDDIDKAVSYFQKCRAKMMSPLKISSYFGKRICFFMLPNMLLVELVEG